jgi:hypothetical protein
MFFKNLPEVEFAFNKSIDTTLSAVEYQSKLFTTTLEFVNEVTDKMFYTYTAKAAETVNSATDYAKENIKTSRKKVADLLGSKA